ncbi:MULTISPECIES: cysteine dioxygenase [Thermomonosporaceae]|uniref:cysteine dioxygenase n=1 Tax=Thermomonosporaceae TaxID=2012 RepID=UPI00255ABE34|nr:MULTISPECIES: cysteine dioxygenase [Thermomonosporaceae]MDL4776193.1 cysteine dioxygenase [Actinomadura xylanilytica]
MNLDMVPDLTMRGQDDPHGRVLRRRPPTVGQLAARVHALAARPGDWWHRVTFDAAAPVRVPLGGADGTGLWLTVWPPGHRTGLHGHAGAVVSAVIVGELAEVTLASDGVAGRALRANRVRVHGGGHTHELTNPGPSYAITLHAGPSDDTA